MRTRNQPHDARGPLLALYQAAVDAASPERAVRRALAAEPAGGAGAPVHLLALGKAARPMAGAAVAMLAEGGRAPAGGVVVVPDDGQGPHPRVAVAVGAHPVPDARSAAAAARLGEAVAAVAPGDEVWVLLSGGASSLAAAPVPGITTADLAGLSALLLASGLDIAAMNAVRKRFSRWGAGRLAQALAERAASRVRCLVLSDVIGDDLAAIGSGPCVADPVSAAELRARLVGASLWEALAPALRAAVDAAALDATRETPKPGAAAFDRVESTIVASNRLSLDAVCAAARAAGYAARLESATLAGEAAPAGRAVGARLRAAAAHGERRCLVWGGETTVTLGPDAGLGGRCQELALAAAAELAGAPAATALLAAGTDGRDGPTDAAGAIVDTGTWAAIRQAGRDPARDLAAHDAYPALDAAGALVRVGLTGTNVMDVVVGVTGGDG